MCYQYINERRGLKRYKAFIIVAADSFMRSITADKYSIIGAVIERIKSRFL